MSKGLTSFDDAWRATTDSRLSSTERSELSSGSQNVASKSRQSDQVPLQLSAPLQIENHGGDTKALQSQVDLPKDLQGKGARAGGLRTYTELVGDDTTIQHAWQRLVVPLVATRMSEWVGGEYTVSLHTAGLEMGRSINIMTPRHIDRQTCGSITQTVLGVLPDRFRSSTTVKFVNGVVACAMFTPQTVSIRGTSSQRVDSMCDAKNSMPHLEPMMGDSVGSTKTTSGAGGTLGPQLSNGINSYWLVNFHIIEDHEGDPDDVDLVHPSRDDCEFPSLPKRLGYLKAFSGEAYKTTRISRKLSLLEERECRLVTDWALFMIPGACQPSSRRMRKNGSEGFSSIAVTDIANDVIPGAKVVSTGRTSGYTQGKIGLVPAIVSGERGYDRGKFHFGNDTGVPTLEWFVERGNGIPENDWITDGIGVFGDSGAGIVADDTRQLFGQVWGRNQYYDVDDQFEPRIAYFTAMSDILDDIEERYPAIGRLDLSTGHTVLRNSVPASENVATISDPGLTPRSTERSSTEGSPALSPVTMIADEGFIVAEEHMMPPAALSRSWSADAQEIAAEPPMRSRARPPRDPRLVTKIKSMLQADHALHAASKVVLPAIVS